MRIKRGLKMTNNNILPEFQCGYSDGEIEKKIAEATKSQTAEQQEASNNQSNIQTFENIPIETIMCGDSAYFKLADISKVLGMNNAHLDWVRGKWFDEDEIITMENSHSGGSPRKYVAESGLYRILNRTNSPKARPFERWVTKEVLPSIRKNGGYIAGQEKAQSELEIIANALIVAQNVINNKSKELEIIKAELAKQKPKVEFANNIAVSTNSKTIDEFAKMLCNKNGIQIGEKRLFAWLRENRYLMQNNLPYQAYLDCGYFELKQGAFSKKDNTIYGYTQTLIAGKGQIYFTNKIIKSKEY